jgi:hypothetical protein
MKDSHQNSPLQLFLLSLSKSKWKCKLLPQQCLDIITLLLSNPDDLWELIDSNDITSCPFIIGYNFSHDEQISSHILQLTVSASSTRWNHMIIYCACFYAIRSGNDRLLLLLFQQFIPQLHFISMTNVHHSLDTPLTKASDVKVGKNHNYTLLTDEDIFKAFISSNHILSIPLTLNQVECSYYMLMMAITYGHEHIVNLLLDHGFKTYNSHLLVEFMPKIPDTSIYSQHYHHYYLAILHPTKSILQCLLNKIYRPGFELLLPFIPSKNNDCILSHQSLRHFQYPLLYPDTFKDCFKTMSPLCFACAIGDVEAIRLILSSFPRPLRAYDVLQLNDSEFESSSSHNPLFFASIFFQDRCLQLLLDHMGFEEFAQASLHYSSKFTYLNRRNLSVRALPSPLSII